MPEQQPEEEEPVAEAAEPVAAVAPAAGVSDALNAVFAGDRSLNILFGSQTGNAAGLAEKTAKLAVDYGLQPNIVDMDGFDPARLATMKRVMIITSTWGEGEMPDNADGMWNAITILLRVTGIAPEFPVLGESRLRITTTPESHSASTVWGTKVIPARTSEDALGASTVREIMVIDKDD